MLTIIGLSLDIIGVVLLGWEFVWRFANDKEYQYQQWIDNLNEMEKVQESTAHIYDHFDNNDELIESMHRSFEKKLKENEEKRAEYMTQILDIRPTGCIRFVAETLEKL